MSHLLQDQQYSPFHASLLFRAVKFHFNQEQYDFYKYNGKVAGNNIAQKNAFESDKRKHLYSKLARAKDPVGLLVSNFIIDPKIYITDVVDERGHARYEQWHARHATRYYRLEKELAANFDSVNQVFDTKSSDLPAIYERYISGDISPETVVLINTAIPILEDTKESLHPLVAQHNLKLRKYGSFVVADRKGVIETFAKVFK